MLALLAAASLGSAHFVATGPPECRRRVLEGVLDLHSFMYEDAREAFLQAQKAAPCPIAYWGEAMTYDHPLWGEEDAAPARAALAKIPPDAKLSPMESGLLEAARALYGGGHAAWMERLGRLHEQLPQDDEVALFYALSLYANSKNGRDVKRAMETAAIAQDVFGRNPDHPGAAHYLIHACDSPEHAVLALKAARRYAQIAPAAGHALHMPSHIFVQLGMWSEVESSNLASFAASEAWVARRKMPASRTDWHSYLWLAAARLELGKPDAVLPMIAHLRDLALREKDAEVRWAHAQLAAMWIESTRQWPRAEEMLALPPLAAEDEPGYVDTQLKYEGPSHNPYGLLARAVAARVRLDVAAAAGDDVRAGAVAAEYLDLRSRIAVRLGYGDPYAEMGKLVAAAKLAEAHSLRDTGSVGDAIEAARKLADAEDREPILGPPWWTPAREEQGELFLRSHRFVEAEQAFRAALDKRPNRLHALRGLAEAARGAEDPHTAEDAQARLPGHVH